MSGASDYHFAELDLIRRPTDPLRLVPVYDCRGWDVLDVGCGIGQTLTAPELSSAASRHGIDVDEKAIACGREMFPQLILNAATAEKIPYSDATFDLVYSRVAIPYTNIPIAISEMHRVTKPGGNVWLSLHSWRTERSILAEAIKRIRVRRLIDRSYVAMNSAMLALVGICFPRPWSGTFESYQFPKSMIRLMVKLSFGEVAASTNGHFCLTGRRLRR